MCRGREVSVRPLSRVTRHNTQWRFWGCGKQSRNRVCMRGAAWWSGCLSWVISNLWDFNRRQWKSKPTRCEGGRAEVQKQEAMWQCDQVPKGVGYVIDPKLWEPLGSNLKRTLKQSGARSLDRKLPQYSRKCDGENSLIHSTNCPWPSAMYQTPF